MAEAQDFEDSSCSICLDSNQFRVLNCGHAFCLNCLKSMHSIYGGKMPCPLDRIEDAREPRTLPTPNQFKGKLFPVFEVDERYTSIDQLLHAQLRCREKTVEIVRGIAGDLNSHEFNCAIAKITGGVFGIAGSVMTIVGLSLTFTGVGAIVGVPLALTGAGIGIAGGATSGITCAVEAFLHKHGIQDVQKQLDLDYFKAEQIKVVLARAAVNSEFAEQWNINSSQFLAAGTILSKLAKLGVTTATGARVAFGIGRATTTAGLHVAGFVLAAAAIPLDLAQIILSSIRVHVKEPSKVIKDIMSIADDLEKELRIFLISEGYFQFIYTNDGHWVYIIIDTEKLTQFKNQMIDGFTLEQLRRFGDVVESGEGDVPATIRLRIQDEWYSHYDKMVAEVLKKDFQPAED